MLRNINHDQINLSTLVDVAEQNLKLASADMEEVVGKPVDSAEAFAVLQREWCRDVEAMLLATKAQRDHLDAKVLQMESLLDAIGGRHQQSMSTLRGAGERYLSASAHVINFVDKISPSRHLSAATKLFGTTVERFQKKGRDIAGKLEQAGNVIHREMDSISNKASSAKDAVIRATDTIKKVVAHDIETTRQVMADIKEMAIDDAARAKIIAGDVLAVTTNLFGGIGKIASKLISLAVAAASGHAERAGETINQIVIERETQRFSDLMIEISAGAIPVKKVAELARQCRLSNRFHENRFSIGNGKCGNLLEAMCKRFISGHVDSYHGSADLVHQSTALFHEINSVLCAAGAKLSPEFVRDNLQAVQVFRDTMERFSAQNEAEHFVPAGGAQTAHAMDMR